MVNSKNRLALFLPNLLGGGAQRVTLNLAAGIADRGYAVDLVVARLEGSYLSQVPKVDRVINLQTSRTVMSLFALIRYLRCERPAALMTSMNYANVIGLWARRLSGVSTRIIVTEHNTLSQASQNASNHRDQLMPRLMTMSYPWANGIIAVSSGVADDLARSIHLPRQYIQVIYNPVITPEVRRKAKATIDHPWFKPNQPPVILAIGRLNKQKDFPTLIQAFARVRQASPARLMILGEGEDRPTLESLVQQFRLEQDVQLPGFVENPYAYLRQATLFGLSSRWEGLPTVLIEALYCGVPVVSTDCPSGAREILKDGQYGQLVPVGDIDRMAQAIKQALREPPPVPAQESWSPFERETVVDQYLRTLLE